MISQEDHEKRLALYQQGLSDMEIGRQLYLSATAIAYWRRKNGLSANHTYRVITPEIDAEMRRLHRDGKSDLAIAREMGLDKDTVFAWRRRKGLPANFKRWGARV